MAWETRKREAWVPDIESEFVIGSLIVFAFVFAFAALSSASGCAYTLEVVIRPCRTSTSWKASTPPPANAAGSF